MANPYFSLLSISWRFALKEKPKYFLTYTMFIGENLTVALKPLLYGWFINGLQRDGIGVVSHMWMYVACYLGIELLQWSLHGPARVMERGLAFSISQNFMEFKLKQLLSSSIDWHTNNHSGESINRLRKAYLALRGFVQSGFSYLHSIAQFVFSFIAVAYFSPLYGSVILALGLFTVWIIFKFDKAYVKILENINESEHVASSKLSDSLSNIMTVITLRLQKQVLGQIVGKLLKVLVHFRKGVLLNEWKWFIANMLVAIMYCVIVVGYVLSNYVEGEVFLLGGLVTLLGFVTSFTNVFYNVAAQYTDIIQYYTDVQTTRNISAASEGTPQIQGSGLPVNWTHIEVRGLSFNYRGQPSQDGTAIGAHFTKESQHLAGGVLKDVNFQFKIGEKIAFIGESGSGKSTMLYLLRGLYFPAPSTKLLLDGVVHESWDVLGNSVTLVPQEPEVFENTIHYNVTLDLDFTEEEVRTACEIAQLSDMIQQLPDGLQYVMKEKGMNISGGQKQRIALARGILASKNSSIVLLDEPTSSVDPETEKSIFSLLFKKLQGKTIIASVHNMDLLPYFDYVYVLKEGKIVDHYQPGQLVGQSGNSQLDLSKETI